MNPTKKYLKPLKTVTSRFIVFTIMLGLPVFSAAKSNIVAIEGVAYSVSSTLAENLKALRGKKVSVIVDSGATITGIVKEIGDHLIHLEKLDNKDFFDALVRIDEIKAIETRFREIKR